MQQISYLILLAILVLFLLQKETFKREIHYRYVVAFLGLMMVFLVTVKISNKDNLSDMIGFAASVASLILALVAIGFAFVSDSSLKGSLKDIIDASKNVKNISADVEGSIQKLIQDVDGKYERLNSTVEEAMREKEDVANVQTSAAYLQADAEHLPYNLDDIASDFLNITSLSGLAILYAVKIAIERNIKKFDLKKMSQECKIINIGYAHGYLIAAISVGLVNCEINDDMIEPISLNKVIREKLLDRATQRASDIDKKYGNDESVGAFSEITSFFNRMS